MARQSLRPHLNQIRTWARQGRTDAWIAHQLDVSVQQITAFKRDNELVDDHASDFDDEIDLRAEDDALVAAELEAVEAESANAEPADSAKDEDQGDVSAKAPRRRGRRRSRARGRVGGGVLEGTFDHGEEGYGLWLDPAVQDDPVYAEYWAGHRPVTVAVEENQIVIRRAGEDEGAEAAG